MRKKTFLAIIALIVLSSFVVLGSSPGLVGNLLETVQNNAITKVFSSEVQTESQNPGNESTEKVQNSEVFPQEISIKTEETPTPKVPEIILWRVIFSFPEKLEKAAEKARQAGQDDSLWTNYFVRQGGLSPEHNQILKENALAYFNEIAPLNEEAKTIVEEWRKKNLPKPIKGDTEEISSRPAPPTGFIELQQQKDEITLRYRDNFKNAIGEQALAKFSEFVNGEFAKGFVMQTGQPPIDRKIDSETENKGFTPFNEQPKREIKPMEENHK